MSFGVRPDQIPGCNCDCDRVEDSLTAPFLPLSFSPTPLCRVVMFTWWVPDSCRDRGLCSGELSEPNKGVLPPEPLDNVLNEGNHSHLMTLQSIMVFFLTKSTKECWYVESCVDLNVLWITPMAQCYGHESVVLRCRDAVTSLGVFKCSLKSEDTGFARSGQGWLASY